MCCMFLKGLMSSLMLGYPFKCNEACMSWIFISLCKCQLMQVSSYKFKQALIFFMKNRMCTVVLLIM